MEVPEVSLETAEEKRRRLKKLLREKINDRNSNNMGNFRKSLLTDPQTALLSMGVDDKSILENADKLVKSAVSGNVKSTASQKSKQTKVDFHDSDEDLPEIPWKTGK